MKPPSDCGNAIGSLLKDRRSEPRRSEGGAAWGVPGAPGAWRGVGVGYVCLHVRGCLYVCAFFCVPVIGVHVSLSDYACVRAFACVCAKPTGGPSVRARASACQVQRRVSVLFF